MTAPNLDSSLREGIDLERKEKVKLVPENPVGRLFRKRRGTLIWLGTQLNRLGWCLLRMNQLINR